MSKISKQAIGSKGEALAKEWFKEQGYHILEQNWRLGRYELDLIAHKNNVLHFIEVKTRSTHHYGYPETAVDRKKFKHMQKAGTGYLHLHPQWKWIQYDILSITLSSEYTAPSYYLCADIYW